MTDDKRKLPDIPAVAAQPVIQAAATISGKSSDELNLEQALEILQGDHLNPILNSFINHSAEKAAGTLRDRITDEQIEQITESAKNGLLKEAFATAQELERQIQEGGTPAAGYTEQQERRIIKTAARITGRSADDLTITEALEIMRSPEAADDLPLLLQDISTAGIFEAFREMAETALNEILQQNLEPIRADQDKQPDGETPIKKETAADDPDDGQREIRIDTPEYDPTLDPNSPEFDREKWATFQKQASENLKATAERMKSALTFEITSVVKAMRESLAGISKANAPTFAAMREYFLSDTLKSIREALQEIAAAAPAWLEFANDIEALTPYLETELQKPEYEGKTIDDLLDDAETDDDGNPLETSLFMQALNAARAARNAAAVIVAQQAGRDQRRIIKENAIASGAIMGLKTGNLITFSERDLWDAFAPGRISKIGTLALDEIDKETGRLTKSLLDKGEIMPVSSIEVSYKTLFLLNTILANSVENYRERFVKDGAITFYVKGVLDDLDIDPRIRDDGQLDINRKTAGVLYLEKQFAPLSQFIGTIPGGSRYSVFVYEGYDVNTDTITIRIPYLFQLWKHTQTAFADRKAARQKRADEGKKPLKHDLKPLEVNALFKPPAYKEDDAVLEIATYITNVLLIAGKGAHKTEISFKTLIKNCPRLREKLDAIDSIPKGTLQENGKKINKTARYNSELRKIARAYSLIMNPDKCDAVRYFSFDSVSPVKAAKEEGGAPELIPPTKSTLNDKISIKWHRIKTEEQ